MAGACLHVHVELPGNGDDVAHLTQFARVVQTNVVVTAFCAAHTDRAALTPVVSALRSPSCLEFAGDAHGTVLIRAADREIVKDLLRTSFRVSPYQTVDLKLHVGDIRRLDLDLAVVSNEGE